MSINHRPEKRSAEPRFRLIAITLSWNYNSYSTVTSSVWSPTHKHSRQRMRMRERQALKRGRSTNIFISLNNNVAHYSYSPTDQKLCCPFEAATRADPLNKISSPRWHYKPISLLCDSVSHTLHVCRPPLHHMALYLTVPLAFHFKRTTLLLVSNIQPSQHSDPPHPRLWPLTLNHFWKRRQEKDEGGERNKSYYSVPFNFCKHILLESSPRQTTAKPKPDSRHRAGWLSPRPGSSFNRMALQHIYFCRHD